MFYTGCKYSEILKIKNAASRGKQHWADHITTVFTS
jgi:hypothetical protein